jgi:magnesium transporter
MPFVSELLGKIVTDVDGERIGRLEDLIGAFRPDVPNPTIAAIAVKRSGDILLVPYADVAVLIAPAIPLNKKLVEITPYETEESDLYLARDVLDKQIIDTNGVRVVRVNDLELVRVNGYFFVANVDIGMRGLMRRMGVDRMTRRLNQRLPLGFISWDDIELLPGNQPMRLRVPGNRIAELHPADLAEILGDLTRAETNRILDSLDAETVAETLEEVEPEFQASLVETMSTERVVDVLEWMSPDEAADLLAELPEDRSAELLNLMDAEDAKDVRKLLTYPDDAAGGIMSTEYVSVRPETTAEQVIAFLRETAEETETIYYVYVTDAQDTLLGVFSLRDLVIAAPHTPVSDFMARRVVSVKLLDSQELVAQVVSKYNLVAVPVVDEAHRLHGVVTADDALDKIIPTAWKKRLPRFYR